MDSVRIGSEEHKRLFCRTFVETHDPFKPEEIVWPDLDAESLARLKSLPVWNEAARTEAATAVKVQALGRTEQDPVLAEAISLQGYEEGRHAEVIQRLTRHYGIEVKPFPAAEVPKNPTWTFLRTGYGECLDSFFAFGLFSLGSKSGSLPGEGRRGVRDDHAGGGAAHSLHRQLGGVPARAAPAAPAPGLRRAAGLEHRRAGRGPRPRRDAARRRRRGLAGRIHDDRATRAFRTSRCAPFSSSASSENERRFAAYDRRLLRPILVPSAVKAILKVLPRGKSATPSSAAA